MSETTMNNLLLLFQNIDDHTPTVRKRMQDAGIAAEPLVTESVAKYWDALEKLAAE